MGSRVTFSSLTSFPATQGLLLATCSVLNYSEGWNLPGLKSIRAGAGERHSCHWFPTVRPLTLLLLHSPACAAVAHRAQNTEQLGMKPAVPAQPRGPVQQKATHKQSTSFSLLP